MTAASDRQHATLAVLAEIANDNIGERLRDEAAARILTAAWRVRAMVPPAFVVPSRGGEGLVDSVAAGWDPDAVTALEYVEVLPPRVVDGLIGAAPRWARAVRARLERDAA
ncbi:hypothetical protein [Muricoccus radiodurans]|uniref:hypothetical protein n=1 Tax=Muricoccus radiodurans TaxID=2231721 RepID=UPI003CE813B2